MKKNLFTFVLSLLVFITGSSLYAQESSAPELTDTEETTEKEEKKGISISGFVDAYYQFSFNENPFPTSFTETHNSFTPGMANVVFSKEGEKFGFVADIAFGPRAEVANGYSGTTLAAIKQLFVTYSPTDKLTFTLGNFGTHVGYEVIDAPANVNYSTSYMFSNGPFYHTGLKVDYAITENFGAMIGLFNDTDTKIDEVSGKHFGAQLSYTDDKTGVFLNYIGGRDGEDLEADTEVTSNQIDLTATYQATEKFGLGLNATTKIVNDSAIDESASWFGAALYANYAVADAFTLGFRGEYIGDEDGLITGVADNTVTNLTLSGNINIGALKLVPEFRVDIAAEESYLNGDGDGSKTSSAFIFAAIYSF